MYYQSNNPQQQQQIKNVYIKNNSNYKLILLNQKQELLCTLEPKQTSMNFYNYDELRSNPYIQTMLMKGFIQLLEQRIEEPEIKHQNHGQKYLIGSTCEIRGEHHLIIEIVQYIPQTGQYKAKLEKTGGIMTLTEREIQPLTEEGQRLRNNDNGNSNANPVDVVVNNESQRQGQQPKAKNVKDIMNDALNELNGNNNYEMPEIITVNQQESRQQAEAAIDSYDVNPTSQPLPQEPKDGEIEENIYIIRDPNTNQKFAKEVKASQIINDTMTQTQKQLQEELLGSNMPKVQQQEVKVNKPNVKDIPENLRKWFYDFLKKDERKRKTFISKCKDKEKLNIILKFCGEYEQNLVKQKLETLG